MLLTLLALGFLAGCVSYRSAKGVSTISARLGSQRAAEPGALPSLDEELWVIARSEGIEAVREPESPGSGALLGKEAEGKEIPLPLKRTAVKAAVNGNLATVAVTQQFENPFGHKIEAVYVFPLPHNAAVSDFVLTIGDRRIRGLIRERAEAERIYKEARQQGYVAALLTQERPNVFTQSVANLEPGQPIDVILTYYHTLAYDDGWYEWVFPLVVGPRFNPPSSTDGVGAVAQGQPGASGQRTEVPYLRPGERSGHNLDLEIDLVPGVSLEETVCRSHAVEVERPDPGHWTVKLKPADTLPNRDFVLRYRVAGERIKANLIAFQEDQGGFLTLMVYPPKELERLTRQPLEVVFVLDCSGSMRGWPITQAKGAVRRWLTQLQPDDTFQLIQFSATASALGPTPLPANPDNVRRGLDYLHGLEGEGGTRMIEGLRAALDFPHDPARLRFVCFLTDGYIGNEAEILGELQRRLGQSRVFSVGIGSSVNRYLIEHLAKLGNGAVAYLGPHDSVTDVIDRFHTRLSHPVMTDLVVDWAGAKVTDVFPRRIPDLFVGRPVILTGRFTGPPPHRAQVRGRIGARTLEFHVPGRTVLAPGNRSLPSVWARLKMADLMDAAVLGTGAEALADEIKALALEFNLLSPYTAFVAVDASRQTSAGDPVTVPVAVPIPEGVEYEMTVPQHTQGEKTPEPAGPHP